MDDQVAFCTNCGSPLSSAAPAYPASESAPDSANSNNKIPSASSSFSNNEYKSYKNSSPVVSEPVQAPAVTAEAVTPPAQAPVAQVSEAPVPIPPPVPQDVKVCPYCGNHCHKNAVICVSCGQNYPSAKSNKPVDVSPAKNGKIISIISIVFCVIGLFSTFVTSVAYETFNLSTLVLMAASIVIIVGFIKGKFNKLPGIGYILSAVSSILSVIILESDISFLFVLSLVQTIMLSAMYLGSNRIRKYWYVPVILSALVTAINYIPILDSYYFGFEDFLLAIFSVIGSAVGSFVVCLNAKINWNVSEDTNSATQY